MSNNGTEICKRIYGEKEGDFSTACLLVSLLIDTVREIPGTVDPRSGDFLPVSLLTLADKMLALSRRGIVPAHDRLFQLTDFLQKPIADILDSPREKIIRTHRMTPVQQAKSFDAESLKWLIRRPGSNAYQKMALSKSVLAVKREFVQDTAENRLFKAFSRELLGYLTLRQTIEGRSSPSARGPRCLPRALSSICSGIGRKSKAASGTSRTSFTSFTMKFTLALM